MSCLTLVIFFLHSLLQISHYKAEYFCKFFNLNDLCLYLVFAVYYATKFEDNRTYMPQLIDLETSPKLDENDQQREVPMIAFYSFLHIMLVMTAFAKFVQYLKVYQSFYGLFQALQHCLSEAVPFTVMMYLWVIIASFLFRVLGVDQDEGGKDHYSIIGPFMIHALNAYRSAIGDTQEPTYSFWAELEGSH